MMETGTLGQLLPILKVGMEIEWIGGVGRTREKVVRVITKIDGLNVSADDCEEWEYLPLDEPYRLISRAQPARVHSPVRDVVTTRKEIVPGVYGHLRVELHPAIGMTYISTHVAGKSDHSIPMGHKDLSAMIATLTIIRDAMEGGQ